MVKPKRSTEAGKVRRLKIQMVVTNEYRPDPRVHKEAKSLIAQGFDVTVLGWDRAASGLPRAECLDGVEVHRVSVPGGRYGAGLLQLVGYVLFYGYLLIYLLRRRRRYQILHCHEVDVLPVCSWIKRLVRVPLVVDFHELYSGRSEGLMPKLMGVVERRYLPQADAFVVVNEEIASYYRPLLKNGLDTVVLPNYPERGHLPSSGYNSGPITISFYGNVRNAKEIITLVEAARLVPGVQVLVAGHGHQATRVAEYLEGQPHAQYLGPFTYEEQPDLYRRSSVVYAVCGLDRNMASAYPVKMWEGLICGQPVIVSKGSVAEMFLVEHNAGVGATGADVDELSQVLTYVRDNYIELAHNARRLGNVHTWDVGVIPLIKLYTDFVQERTN